MEGRNWSDTTSTYRYGFQGQEEDPETGYVNYKYRMHDTRIGRFFAVDPMAASFPWSSPYAFSENRVIGSVELEGLEAVDLNTNETVNEPFSSQGTMNDYKSNDDTEPWSDLIGFTASQSDVDKADKRVFGTPKLQTIESGNGQLNVDYYSAVISKLPEGISSGEELLNYFRNNLNSFTDRNTSFGPYNNEEGRLFSENQNSALMSFEVFLGGFFNADDLSVMQSKNSSNYWVFSTMTTFRDGGHPVSGNRQFGVTSNANGTYTFFTRGADRPNSMLDKVSSSMIFEGADNLWQAVMTNMVNYVNENGGDAKRNVTFGKQIDWNKE